MDDQSKLLELLRHHWGYHSLRPLQEEAVQAVMEKRDSLVILPTGGGKSLCYQLPALMRPGMMVVVSPLIALMKDQVDGLVENGISAVAINSTLTRDEKFSIAGQIERGEIQLLYVAPEKLSTSRMISFLQKQQISAIAVDEAHCISSWGHQFRPEYRMLGQLREFFPDVDLHAYTATATERVRDDVIEQLQLRDPVVLSASFDRPNLTYRIRRRSDFNSQVRECLDKYKGQSGIIYCISRRQVDELTESLQADGYRVGAYHAGLDHETRQQAQEDFLAERIDIVVATVAFGMGIDKPNVRFVIHAGATKSLENYQQETGRAGRDGLPSECTLFYTGHDFATWKRMSDDLTGDAATAAESQLRAMSRYCSSLRCRHQSLVEYFGQMWDQGSCSACDVCLGEVELLPESNTVAQKILSCVIRVNERFGGEYVTNVLIGSKDRRIQENSHNELSTYGLLKEFPKSAIRGWIDQLVDQECLCRDQEHHTLSVTEQGRDVFDENFAPRLSHSTPSKKAKKASAPKRLELNPDEQELFEVLRVVRKEIAEEKGIAPFIVFGDVSLIDMVQRRPKDSNEFLEVHGVGAKKAAEYSERFLEAISEFSPGSEIVSP